MSCGASITIKNYHNGGGDLTLKIKSAQYSESASNGGRNRLIIYRDPDQHSSRLGMFAYLWHNQPGYETLGFPELTLQFTQCNDSGVVISIATNVYFSVYVDSIKPSGTEEVITFLARSKTAEFRFP
jgi:hypothetical protein